MTLDFDLLAWFIGITILVVLIGVLWRRRRSTSHLFCFAVFWVYLMFGVNEAFFPIQITGDYVEAMRQVPFMSQVNFALLYFGPFPDPERILIAGILNIILTVPVGFGVSFITRVKAKDFLWLAIGVGLGIEAIQLAISLALRYPYRVIDVNDALFNTVGVLVGFGFFRLFARWYLAMTQQLGIEHAGLSAYVHHIASHAQPARRAIE
jgi:glycopeptide antibiotics resistance protein